MHLRREGKRHARHAAKIVSITNFIIAHVGSYADNLRDVARMLDALRKIYRENAKKLIPRI